MMCSIFSYSDFSICIIFGVIFDKVFGSFEKSDCFLLLRVFCIFYISPFLDIYFSKIFFQSVAFFIYLIVSFTEQKIFILMMSLMATLLLNLNSDHQRHLLIWDFYHIIFQELYNFAFYIQVCGPFCVHFCERIRSVSRIFFVCGCAVLQHHLLRRVS